MDSLGDKSIRNSCVYQLSCLCISLLMYECQTLMLLILDFSFFSSDNSGLILLSCYQYITLEVSLSASPMGSWNDSWVRIPFDMNSPHLLFNFVCMYSPNKLRSMASKFGCQRLGYTHHIFRTGKKEGECKRGSVGRPSLCIFCKYYGRICTLLSYNTLLRLHYQIVTNP